MFNKFIVLLCILATAGSSLLPLEIERIHSIVGGFAVMNCHLDFPFGNEIPYHLQWDKDGEIILSWFTGDSAPYVLDRFGGRLARLDEGRQGLGGGSINVTAVRETDAGLYRCRVTFPNRTPPARNNGTFYYLDVDGSNHIVTPPMNSTVLENERTEFECLPKSPESTVQWYKDGVKIGDLPELATRAIPAGNGSLVIPQASIADPGEYECQVEAPDGQVQSASAFLDVQYKAKVVYAPQEQYLPHGKPASLDCHFSANPPLTNLRWEKDGFLFDPYNVQGVFYSRNGSLLFNFVDESHEGSYSCTPYNALGTQGPSPLMKVRVQKPPAFSATPLPLYLTKLEASVTLPCATHVMNNDLSPAIEWTRKDRRPLPEGRTTLNGGNLTITDVEPEDRGIYTCVARNDASSISADTELLIENVPPRAPYNVTALPGTTTIHVSWLPGHTEAKVDFKLWYREKNNSQWRTMKTSSRDVFEETIVDLKPGTEYELRVLSDDHLGDGLFSKPLFVTTLDEELTGNEASYAVVVTESAGVSAPLSVSVRLVDNGALVRWLREHDESQCTVKSFLENSLVAIRHTRDNYVLLPEVEDGAHYHVTVECSSGSVGSSSVNVPEYNRLRAVAAGCAVAGLLLAALAVAVYFARDRVCGLGGTRRR